MKHVFIFFIAILLIIAMLLCITNWSILESYIRENIVFSVIQNQSGHHHIKGFSIDEEVYESASDVQVFEKLLRASKYDGTFFVHDRTKTMKLLFSGFDKLFYVEWLSESELSIATMLYGDTDKYRVVFSDVDRRSELYAILKRKVPK